MALQLFFFLTLFYATSAQAKSSSPLVIEVMTAQEVVNEIEAVLQKMQDGSATIRDNTCTSPSYTKQSDHLKASANNLDSFVVITEATIQGRAYSASYCERQRPRSSSSTTPIKIECSATEKNPQSSPAQTLSFSMSYLSEDSGYIIESCPSPVP